MSSTTHSTIRQACPPLGCGIGLRAPHFGHVLETLPPVDWFEVIAENFIGTSSAAAIRPVHVLERLREHYPIVIHGVSLSVGSTEPVDRVHLAKLRELYARIDPAWISDHLC